MELSKQNHFIIYKLYLDKLINFQIILLVDKNYMVNTIISSFRSKEEHNCQENIIVDKTR